MRRLSFLDKSLTRWVSTTQQSDEASRDEPKTANPSYHARRGESGFETMEFSKISSEKTNPQDGFATLMTCSESEQSRPVVKDASLRGWMLYLDPKFYVERSFETLKDAEPRDDLGRLDAVRHESGKATTELE